MRGVQFSEKITDAHIGEQEYDETLGIAKE